VDGFSGGRLLVLDEDGPGRDALSAQLQAAGHHVDVADSAVRVDEAVAAHRPDLVLVTLPTDDLSRGLAAGERIRRTSGTPFVFVGGWLSLEERVRSFEAGAEDVIWLPCPSEELRARLAVVLRRRGHRSDVLEFDDIVVDTAAHTVTRAGNPVRVTSLEFALLVSLVRHRGRVLSKTHLLDEVWGYADYDVNLVEVHVSALRRKLELHGPRVVHTVRGVGYVLRPAASVSAAARATA
jgi:DNA-binding response OmpR family regulator